MRRSASLTAEDDNYFVGLTYCFKEYLENMFQCRIIGKTSTEIIDEITGIHPLDTVLSDIRAWLTECDRMKFTGIKVLREQKLEHYWILLDLVKEIDAGKTDANKEGAA